MPTRIDWCDETCNPLGHGCYGPGGDAAQPNICPYCYAHTLAKRDLRGCPQCKAFIPHTHFEQLDKLSRWKNPRRVFMQSMGDLFHPEVPDEWIDEVFSACLRSPQHNYMFLTKNPQRYSELFRRDGLPDYHWYGYTATNSAELWSFRREEDCPCSKLFVSIEPIMGPIIPPLNEITPADWIILGSETGNRPGKVSPKREWIEQIVAFCNELAGIPVFMKGSLAPIWGEPLIQQFPEGLRKEVRM